jgi:hypothetical protein
MVRFPKEKSWTGDVLYIYSLHRVYKEKSGKVHKQRRKVRGWFTYGKGGPAS